MAGSGEQFVPMYFLFIAALLGAVTLLLVERYTFGKLPYVLCIFVEGIVLGYIANQYEDQLGDFSSSFITWQQIDPFLLMAVFLPGLLFGDGMETVTYQLGRIVPQLILLCLIGVFIMTCLIAIAAFYLLQGSNWNITACFLFGAILSSPDPVVLISLLESSSNVPEKFKLLSGSESHFCDLTSFTLFKIFFGIITLGLENQFPDVGSYFYFFFTNIVGGPVLGVALGFLGYYGIKHSKLSGRPLDVLVQITITVVVAYMSFLISEHVLAGNGILATVCASLVLAAYAKPTYADINQVESVWKTIEYFATSIVIFLSGVIAAEVVFEAGIEDWGAFFVDVILIYISVMVARAIMIFVLFKPLNKVGHLGISEAICMTWCNIRGALTLTLALAVYRLDEKKYEDNLNLFLFDSGVDDNSSRLLADDSTGETNEVLRKELSKFYLLIATVTLLTIVINITLAPQVFAMSKLEVRSEYVVAKTTKEDIQREDKTVKAYIHQRVKKRYREILHEIESTKARADLIDRKFLSRQLSNFDLQDYESLRDGEATVFGETAKFIGEIKREDLEGDKYSMQELQKGASKVELRKMQALFYRALKKSYWSQIDDGIIPKGSKIALQLLYSAEIGADERESVKSDFEGLNLPRIDAEKETVEHNRVLGFLYRLIDICTPLYLFEQYKSQIIRDAVYAASCYIDAHRDAEEKIAGSMGATAAIDTYEEAIIIKNSIELTKVAEKYIGDARILDPDVDRVVETLKAAAAMIEGHRKYVKELSEEGLLQEIHVQKEYMDLAREKKKG